MSTEESVVRVKKYLPFEEGRELLPVDRKEVWRYSGYSGVPGEEDKALSALLDEVAAEALPVLAYRICYRSVSLTWQDGMPVLPFSAPSKDLARCLKNSVEVLFFAATVGLELDRRIERYQRVSPAKALLFQALGAERIEALCDLFCREMGCGAREKGLELTPRFSPGYGDLPIEVQRDLFRLLDCQRKIGLTLNSSLLMSPSKSVTAILGLRPGGLDASRDGHGGNKCGDCPARDCSFRRKDEE
ncbi:MAG: vitamin B12 dependent-methionine synthase activation domain-containing protein [Bacillota bacterium]|nr:vitamin B12 dependent-methionine synthase activation domain-containing protein [Bacillota bacterium]